LHKVVYLFKKRIYNWKSEEWKEIEKLEEMIKKVLIRNNWEVDSVEFVDKEGKKLIFNIFENFDEEASWYAIIEDNYHNVYVYQYDGRGEKPRVYKLVY
jgi:hypothetical protein